MFIGLCGRRSCEWHCHRVCHCPVGSARGERLLAQRALARFSRSPSPWAAYAVRRNLRRLAAQEATHD